MSKEIPLTRGKFAIVDDDLFDWLNQFKWCCSDKGYAKKGASAVYMHRLIMGNPPGEQIDHIDLNPLNNQRNNLRVASRAQNKANSFGHSNRSAFYKGVRWVGRKWQAQITINGTTKSLGSFKTQLDAAMAYNNAATKAFGKFAKLNDLSQLAPNDESIPDLPKNCEYRGVHRVKNYQQWIASCSKNDKKQYLGSYNNPEDAARAYDSFVKKHGLDRPLNFPT
ncbi:MAG: AP2 domain-containing protein [Gallionella sp.]|nr:AP2 domain-containing protein [Gallionella sp.]